MTSHDETMKRVTFTSDDIGVMLLESITTGLYHNPLNAVREYVQNEVDAGAVDVRIVSALDKLLITGDGVGMTHEELLHARQIGFSDKDPSKNVGFRGIGIWSGVAICDELFVSTKKSGDPHGYVMKIDAGGLRADIMEGAMPLVNALSSRVFLRPLAREEFTSRHGTSVELRRLLPEHSRLLNRESLLSYVRQILPVEIDPGYRFAKFVTEKLRVMVPGYRTVKVTVNDTVAYRPPRGTVETLRPTFRILKRDGHELAVVWYAVSDKGQIEPDARHLTYKKHGFTVGDTSRSNLFVLTTTNRHVLAWSTGEIHVTDDRILPTSERIDFESSETYRELEEQAKNLLNEVVLSARRAQAGRTAEERLQYPLTIRPRFLAMSDPEERVNLFIEGKDLMKYLEQDMKNPNLSKDLKKRVLRTKNRLRRDLEFLAVNFDAPAGLVETRTETASKRRGSAPEAKEAYSAEQLAGELGAYFPFDRLSLLFLGAVLSAVNRVVGGKVKKVERFVALLKEELKETARGK